MTSSEVEIIKKNKEHILEHLYEWAETFDWELDEDGERTSEPYDFVFGLAEKLEQGTCSEKDYEEIYFHIGQINHDETKILL